MIKTLFVIRSKLNKRNKYCILSRNTLFLELLFVLFAALVICEIPLQAEEASQDPDWENPMLIGINKEKAHASLVLPSEKAADSSVI
mgnify:CR=1 FL=1